MFPRISKSACFYGDVVLMLPKLTLILWGTFRTTKIYAIDEPLSPLLRLGGLHVKDATALVSGGGRSEEDQAYENTGDIV